jgi:hypothetical protein
VTVNNKTKGTYNMKNRNIHYRRTIPALLIALALGCFSIASAQVADKPASGPMIGLWHVHYFHGTEEWLQTYDQWGSDGLELEVAGLAPGAGAIGQGHWGRVPDGTLQLYQVAWTFDTSGVLNGYTQKTEENTLSDDKLSWSGSYSTTFYDLSGNPLSQDTGTLTATRLPPHHQRPTPTPTPTPTPMPTK